MGIFSGKSWRGDDGEDDMTQDDWAKRGVEQAIADLRCGDPFASSPDEKGIPTGGCYNADYPDSFHEAENKRLETDEHYEAQVGRDVETLFRSASLERADESLD
jgi:hypothetical protein